MSRATSLDGRRLASGRASSARGSSARARGSRSVRARFKVPRARDEPPLASAPRAPCAWSSRLDVIATMVMAPLGGRERGVEGVVDACCGHALLGLGLCERGARTLAIDRSAAECERALENVDRARKVVGDDVASRVEIRLGDGLGECPEARDADVVVVAGVGANTMAKVLESGGLGLCSSADERSTSPSTARLVLNPPAKDGAATRRWLAENGWTIRDEKLVVENEIMHLVVSAERDAEIDTPSSMPLSVRDEIIGPVLGEGTASESPLLKLYVTKRLEWLREVRRQASLSAQRLAKKQEKSDSEYQSVEALKEKIAGYDEMESVLLAAIGVDVEEQRRNAHAHLEQQILRSYDGFDLKPGILAYKTVDPEESDGRLAYCREFLSESEASELMSSLVSSPPVDWAQRSIVCWQPQENTKKEVVQPRLVSWAGDIAYKYSGQTLEPVPVPDVLRRLQTKVEQVTGERFNHILLNRYRDGSDSMALHADDEPELGRNACIAAVSIGHVRRFDVQLKSKAKKKMSIFLENGSLMVMDRSLQHSHYHGVPKVTCAQDVEGERINITFRLLKGPPGWRED